MNVVVGRARNLLGALDDGGLGFGQALAGAVQVILQLGAQFGHFLAGLAGGGPEDLLGVGDDDLEVGDEFLLVDFGHFGHGFALRKNGGYRGSRLPIFAVDGKCPCQPMS